jgi:pimeloyl-ACP methyl ester carboxylesterase
VTTEPRHEHHALASGVELHTVRWGPADAAPDDPPPVLLVHGLASNARLWDGVGRRLGERGHAVAAVDQRGHGRSSKPDDGYDMVTVADDLAMLVHELGWHRPLVAGQSWGGNVVLELASRHPGAVRAIACVDGGFIDLRSRFPDWDEAATTLAPPRLAGTPIDTIRSWLSTSAADWPEEGRDGTLANFEVRHDGTIAPWLTFERHLLVLRGLWEHPVADRFASVQVPVLLIPADTGAVDWTHEKEAAVRAAEEALAVSRTEWFRPAHHDVHAQRPADVADLLHRAATDPGFFPAPAGDGSTSTTETIS